MTEGEELPYRLDDPRPIAAGAPYTFFRPTEAQLTAVAEGDLVQLIFELVPTGVKYGAERMWVEIAGVGPGGLTGRLKTQPDEARMEVGDEVKFQRFHIINIYWKDPASAPPPSSARDYWDRCLVDDCVLDGTEPVEFVYREEPDMQNEGDEFPDSGWRIRGRCGDATDDQMEQRGCKYVALGAVLNKDDSWVHLLDEPVGSRFMRDFNTGKYEAEQA